MRDDVKLFQTPHTLNHDFFFAKFCRKKSQIFYFYTFHMAFESKSPGAKLEGLNNLTRLFKQK